MAALWAWKPADLFLYAVPVFENHHQVLYAQNWVYKFEHSAPRLNQQSRDQPKFFTNEKEDTPTVSIKKNVVFPTIVSRKLS